MSIKKSKTLFCVVVLALLCCASCKKNKETEMVTLRLQCEQPTDPTARQKVYLDADKLVNWYVTDSIRVNNGSPIHVYNNTANVGASNSYTAVYPYKNSLGNTNSANNGSVTVTIPAVQTYVADASGNQIMRDLPMGAYLTGSAVSDSPVLMFRNLASLIRVTVENPSTDCPFRIYSIRLSSSNSKKLSGTFKWDFSGSSNSNVPAQDNNYSGSSSNEVVLDLNANDNVEMIPANGSKTYFLIVTPITESCTLRADVRGAIMGNYGGGSGTIAGEAVKIRYKEFTSNPKTLDRSLIGTVNVNLRTSSADYTVTGGFTMGVGDVKYFAPGNLRKKSSKYTFAHEQYDIVGARTCHDIIGGVSTGYYDLFKAEIISKVPQRDIYPYYPNMTYYDPAGTWRCPTSTQFNYMLGSRGVYYSYVKASVNGQSGLILFPDVFSMPSGINIVNRNTDNTPFTDNNISLSKWRQLEINGAIFLPTTGLIRIGEHPSPNVDGREYDHGYTSYKGQDNVIGYYWMDDGWHLYFQHMANSFVSVVTSSTEFLYAIRPVRN